MPSLIRAGALMAALAIAAPALAQQAPASHKTTKHRPVTPAPEQAGYMSACGAHFRCYDRIPLDCADNTRPFQNIAQHQCLCVHDGCPQTGF